MRINALFSHYKNLLTPRQQSMVHDYYENNYTLSEIANNENISRNAVHDQLQKTIKKLDDYEDKLALLNKSQTRQDIIDQLKKNTSDATILELLETLEKVD